MGKYQIKRTKTNNTLFLSGKPSISTPCHQTKQRSESDHEKVQKFMQTKRQKLISERKAKDEADQLEKNRVQQRLLALEAWRKQQQSLKVSYKSPDLLARSLTAFFRNVFAGPA